MGSIVDGQPVNAATTNNSKLDRITDDVAYGKISLQNPGSSSITSVQDTLNILIAAVGGSQLIPATGYSPVPSNTINSTETHEQALRALAQKFYGAASAGGHSHTGADGDGALIASTRIAASGFSFISGDITLAASGGSSLTQVGNTIYIIAGGGGGVGMQESPAGLVDGTNAIFSLSSLPSSSASVTVFVDGLIVPQGTGYAASGQQITFNAGFIPQPSQDVYAFYLVGGSASSGTSSGGITAHGTKSAPILVNPTVGILASTTEMDQVWWVKPTTSGAQSISSSPAIRAGTIVGQRLTIYGVSSSDYLIIPDAAGTNQNGVCGLTNNQAIQYNWNGIAWQEFSRRS